MVIIRLVVLGAGVGGFGFWRSIELVVIEVNLLGVMR